MKTVHTVIFLIILILCLPAQGADRRQHVLKGPVPVVVERVIDGDTFLARAQVWLGQEITVLVRIRGIDAPEKKARCASERVAAFAARDGLSAILARTPVELRNISGEKYFGRVLADVVTIDALDPARLLLDQELVRPYKGKKRQSWC